MCFLKYITILLVIILIFRFKKFAEKYDSDKFDSLNLADDSKNALKYAMRFLKKSPMDYVYNNQVAYCLIKLGRANEAINYLEKAIMVEPENDNAALNNMAWAYYELRDDNKCIHYCDLSLSIDSKDKWTLVNKANALLRQEKLEEANTYYDDSLLIDDNFSTGLYGKALCCNHLEDYDNAIVYYKKYCIIEPNDLDGLLGLSHALFQKKNYEETIKIYNKILAVDSKLLGVYCDKADALSYIGEFEEALSSLDTALSIDSKYALGYYYKARIFSHLRLKEEALYFLGIAFELCPDYKNIAKDDIHLHNLQFFSQFHEMMM